ncbi:MAG: histidine kinase N-terminal 7TM domain-containing protein, partial [Patescibacteria group bacterium]
MRIFFLFILMVSALSTTILLVLDRPEYLLPLYVFIANFSMGLLLLLNNYQSKANRAFSVINFSIAIWTTSIFLYWYTSEPGFALWCSKMAYASTSFIPGFLLYFSLVFPSQEKPISRATKTIIFGPIILMLILDLSNQIVQGVEKVSWGLNLVPGPFYVVYTIYFLCYMLAALAKLIMKYRRVGGREKQQIAYVFFGFLIGSSLPIVTNLILPSIGNTSFTATGPSFSIVLTAFITYAITKHHLMDISVIISRAVAEILAILFHGIIYLTLVWLYRVYLSSNIDLLFMVWTVVYGIIVGQTHQSMRTFFQTTSEKLFLR